MKPFINKFFLVLGTGFLLAACSTKTEEQPVQEVEETVVVEEVFQPAVSVVEEKPQPVATKPAPAVQPQKDLYPNEVLLRVKEWDQKLKFLKTHFDQTSEYDGVMISKSQGTLFYDKDKNLLRLDTINSDDAVEQSAITDKRQILILDGQGREITTLAWQEWQQGQPNQALFDFGNYTALLNRHHATLQEPYLLALTPKEGEPYTLYLTLSKQDYFPVNIKIVSDLMTTEAVLSDIHKNETLPFNTFRAGGFFK